MMFLCFIKVNLILFDVASVHEYVYEQSLAVTTFTQLSNFFWKKKTFRSIFTTFYFYLSYFIIKYHYFYLSKNSGYSTHCE